MSVFTVAAAALTAFNLACSGTMDVSSIAGDKTEPYSSVYRIDLASRKYCEADCRAVLDIADVQPTQIALQNKAVNTPSRRSLTANLIDRETGAQTITATSSTPGEPASIIIMKWTGRCERQPFSGFPTFETKF